MTPQSMAELAESPGGDPHPGLLFYCQHSLGIGHLMRSFALCQALSARYRVQLLCGGRIPQGIVPPGAFEVIALPPIAANLDFSLVSHDAAGDLEQTFERRAGLIVEQFRALRPAVVVVELFPFGRKKFSRELLPLLEAAREPPRPLVVCSLRDLLVGRADQQEHDERTPTSTPCWCTPTHASHDSRRPFTLGPPFESRCSTPGTWSGPTPT